jgi:3-hydroxyisobutyrate dehydrogenase-like beta-hydroxyacid dehydrogenase
MAVPLAIKDLRLALAEAENEAVPMPAASLVHERLVALAARKLPSSQSEHTKPVERPPPAKK